MYAALEAGASGYLLKSADADEVAAAVRAAHRGVLQLDPAIARRLMALAASRAGQATRRPSSPRASSRCCATWARGSANKEIAAALSISERTARAHVSSILGKLGLSSRTQAAVWAEREGLVDRRRYDRQPARAAARAAGAPSSPARSSSRHEAERRGMQRRRPGPAGGERGPLAGVLDPHERSAARSRSASDQRQRYSGRTHSRQPLQRAPPRPRPARRCRRSPRRTREQVLAPEVADPVVVAAQERGDHRTDAAAGGR